MWEKKTGGGITTLVGDNMTKCDLGPGEKCQGAVQIQMFWPESDRKRIQRVREQGQSHPKGGRGRINCLGRQHTTGAV